MFKFAYDGQHFEISVGSLSLYYNASQDKQRILRFPMITLLCNFESVNTHNPIDSSPPLFIPVDASRILDNHYDPFVDYRTSFFKIELDVNFCETNESASVNFDVIQPVIDDILSNKAPKFSTYFDFVRKDNAMNFSGVKASVRFPSITISMPNESLTAKISEFSFGFDFDLIDQINVTSQSTISVPKFDAIFSSLGQNLGILTFTKLIVISQKSHNSYNNISVDTISADVQPQLIAILMQFDIRLPEKTQKNPLKAPEFINGTNIDGFTDSALSDTSISVKEVHVQLLDGSNFPPTLNVDEFSFSILTNDRRESIRVLQFNQFQMCTSYYKNHPLMRSNQMKLNFAMDAKHLAVYLQMNGSTEVHLRPADFDVIIPQLKMLLPAAMKPKLEEKSGTKMSMNIVISIEHSIIINFMKNDDKVLAMVMATGFNLTHVSDVDGSEDTQCSLMHLRATDETTTDEFHDAFCSDQSESPQFRMFIQERKKTMKCPVFNSINIALKPFTLHVSMKFIDDMIKFFPSTLDLNIFDLDQTDISEEKVHTNQVYLGVGSKDDDTEVVGFYRRVKIEPFVAMMSYRGLPESFIHEILNREFHFDKIQLTDLFGTKEQIKAIIKNELKWNLIKAIPKMALKAK